MNIVQWHHVKCWPGPFDDIDQGWKRADYRLNDRNYQAGDMLLLREWSEVDEAYTGRLIRCEITHVQQGGIIPDGYAVLSIEVEDRGET